jgi:(p)ppGpp synthase/HD superfamily hydrolase
MNIRSFALTYPQLMSQAIAQGWEEPSLSRLRSGHEFAERAFAGLYRGQGAPFICHLVRSASIVLAERQPAAVVLATLLHAAYMLNTFDPRRFQRAAEIHHRHLRDSIGPDVESLIQSYDRLPWYTAAAFEGHMQHLESYSGSMRQVLLMRLANELEDHLDLAMAYRGAYPFRERIASFGNAAVELAVRLGHVELASELRETFDAHLKSQLPAIVQRQRRKAYVVPARGWLVKSPWQRARTESKLLLQRLAGR